MHGFADGYFVSENELVKEINLYLARLDLAATALRHIESQSPPVSPAVYAAAMELKIIGGQKPRNTQITQTKHLRGARNNYPREMFVAGPRARSPCLVLTVDCVVSQASLITLRVS